MTNIIQNNVVNLKEYRDAQSDAKAKAQLDDWAKMWIAYWCWLGGVK